MYSGSQETGSCKHVRLPPRSLHAAESLLSAGMQPAFPWQCRVPATPTAPGQDLPLLGLMFWPLHCHSHGLAPAKLLQILTGSDCGSRRVTCLSLASLTSAWGPRCTHAWSIAVGQHDQPQPACTSQNNSTTGRNTNSSLSQSQ